MKLRSIVTAFGAMVLCSGSAFADYLNLLNGGVGSLGGGIYFDARAAITTVGTVGTGNIDPFVQIQDIGIEEGYNTSGNPKPFDEGHSPNFNHDVTLGMLHTFIVPVGDGIPTDTYYRFLLDINQQKSEGGDLLSLDQLRLYHSAQGGINSTSFAGMTPIWSMDDEGSGDAGCVGLAEGAACDTTPADNGVELNYALHAGSGNGYDMFLWVPQHYFDGLADGEFIYLYSSFGELGGEYAGNDGFEEWAREVNGPTDDPPPPPVPEPASLILLGIGLTAVAVRKHFSSGLQ